MKQLLVGNVDVVIDTEKGIKENHQQTSNATGNDDSSPPSKKMKVDAIHGQSRNTHTNHSADQPSSSHSTVWVSLDSCNLLMSSERDVIRGKGLKMNDLIINYSQKSLHFISFQL